MSCINELDREVSQHVDRKDCIVSINGFLSSIIDALITRVCSRLYNVENKSDSFVGLVCVDHLSQLINFVLCGEDYHIDSMFPSLHQGGQSIFPNECQDCNESDIIEIFWIICM